jgi:hypothetical protein
MMRFLAQCLLAGALLASGCVTREPTPTLSFATLPPPERDVYLTIYREMFAHWQGQRTAFPKRFFLSCQKQDVGPDLLTQLQREGYQVAAGSRYRHGRGIQCSAARIAWTSATEARVWGGYLYGPLGGEWGYFRLRKDNENWTVVSWKPEVFS